MHQPRHMHLTCHRKPHYTSIFDNHYTGIKKLNNFTYLRYGNMNPICTIKKKIKHIYLGKIYAQFLKLRYSFHMLISILICYHQIFLKGRRTTPLKYPLPKSNVSVFFKLCTQYIIYHLLM